MTTSSSIAFAIKDICEGFVRLPTSWELALEDLRDRYRRSVIGLIWIIVSFIAFITIKQLVFAQLFQADGYDYISHLVIGFALFTFISAVIPGGAHLLVTNRTWILSSNLPYSLFANVLILRGFIELALLAVASAVLIAVMGEPAPARLWSLPLALALYFLSAFGLCLALAPIGARFRDSVYAVQTMMRMLFFATPIIWLPTPGTMRGTIAKWNPLTYYLDIVRAPLITGEVHTLSWLVATAATALILVAGAIIFTVTRKRVAHWL